MTADAIRVAQPFLEPPYAPLQLVQLQVLREQDFGYFEGKSYIARPPHSDKTGREVYNEEHKDQPGFQDMESKESMAKRMDAFLDDHLLPLLDKGASQETVVIVSHGIILQSLWRCLLKRFPPDSVSIGSTANIGGGPRPLEYLAGWSNTGYLELDIFRRAVPAADPNSISPEIARQKVTVAAVEATSATKAKSLSENPGATLLMGWRMIIRTVNGKDHLRNLKRTGGGLGSTKYDKGQKDIGSFFKKQKKS